MGDLSSSQFCPSKNIEWYRGSEKYLDNKVVVFTDMCFTLVEQYKNEDVFKIAWLIEPPAITSNTYQYIEAYQDKFDLILSHQKDFVSRIKNAVYAPFGGCWIPANKRKQWQKRRMVNIFASSKTFTDGHQLRHLIISGLRQNKYPIDVFGHGYQFIKNKEDGMISYRFSICIENSQHNGYFTEKIVDAFVTGTIPIYWGCKDIGEYFDQDGILTFNNEEELTEILNSLSKQTYENMTDVIGSNFEFAKKYMVAEDWFYTNILKPRGIV